MVYRITVEKIGNGFIVECLWRNSGVVDTKLYFKTLDETFSHLSKCLGEAEHSASKRKKGSSDEEQGIQAAPD